MGSLRKMILRELCASFPQAFSGKAFSRELGVSRVAVWKEVQSLQKLGFPIESSRKGYRLSHLPDSLFGEYLEVLLEGAFPGLRVLFFEELPSTSTEAKELAQKGYPEGTLVVAENQTRGRGRLGRGWFGEPGKSLAFSLLLRPAVEPRLCPPLSLLIALALSLALENLGFPVTLKWPNDLFLAGKKVAGVLLESASEMDRVEWVIAGVGVNVNVVHFPPELKNQATSLSAYAGKPIERFRVLQAFLGVLGNEYPRFVAAKTFAPWMEVFSSRFAFLGKPVEVVWGEKRYRGVAQRIDEDGALWVGGKRFAWGEVSLLVNL